MVTFINNFWLWLKCSRQLQTMLYVVSERSLIGLVYDSSSLLSTSNLQYLCHRDTERVNKISTIDGCARVLVQCRNASSISPYTETLFFEIIKSEENQTRLWTYISINAGHFGCEWFKKIGSCSTMRPLLVVLIMPPSRKLLWCMALCNIILKDLYKLFIGKY